VTFFPGTFLLTLRQWSIESVKIQLEREFRWLTERRRRGWMVDILYTRQRVKG